MKISSGRDFTWSHRLKTPTICPQQSGDPGEQDRAWLSPSLKIWELASSEASSLMPKDWEPEVLSFKAWDPLHFLISHNLKWGQKTKLQPQEKVRWPYFLSSPTSATMSMSYLFLCLPHKIQWKILKIVETLDGRDLDFWITIWKAAYIM